MTVIKTNLDKAPYYDRTNSEIDKDYSKVLFVSGQRLNSMELNTMQGLILGQIRKVTDKIITDGCIVSGCSFTNDKNLLICTLSKGEIYLHGLIVQIPETKWTYQTDTEVDNEFPSGNVIIWADIKSTIYTANDDNTLYNPSEEYESFGDTGAHRLKYVAVVVAGSVDDYNEIIKINKNIVPLLKIYNRECIGTFKPSSIYGSISAEMAQRTYDQSGDFIATGLVVSAAKAQNDPANKYKAVISSGRCYVQGWQYKFNDNYIICDNATINTNSTLVENIPESINYTGNDNNYYLSHKYVKEIITIKAPCDVEGSYRTTSNYGDILLTNSNIKEPDRVLGITQVIVKDSNNNNIILTSNKTNSEIFDYSYSKTTDGPILKWNNNASTQEHILADLNLNTSGKAVTIVVSYKETLSLNSDYTVTYDKVGAYLKFKTDKLTKNNNIDVHYSWYMPRIDLVYISSTGYLSIKCGAATDIQTLTNPTTPLNALPLAYITVVPNTDANEFKVTQYGLYRLPLGELHSLKKRVETIEYNAVMTQIEQSIANAHTEQDSSGYYSLQNIFTDPLIDYTKADTQNKLFDATIDVYKNRVTLPMVINQIGYSKTKIIDSDGNVISGGVTTCNIAKNSDDTIQKLITSQVPFATSSIDLVPYYFKGLIPTLSCDPVKLVNVENDETTEVEWLPARVVYNANYVDTLVNTIKEYTGTTIVTYNTTNN